MIIWILLLMIAIFVIIFLLWIIYKLWNKCKILSYQYEFLKIAIEGDENDGKMDMSG